MELVEVEELVLHAVLEQMRDHPLSLIGKGINQAGLESKKRGLRSKSARRYGSGSGLADFVLGEVLRPDRSELTDVLVASAAEALLDPSANYEDILMALGTAYFKCGM